MAQRTPEEIRASIEANRAQLGVSVNELRGEIAELTDWRGHIARAREALQEQIVQQREQLRDKIGEHRKQLLIGAAVTGFLIGGGIAASSGLFRRNSKK